MKTVLQIEFSPSILADREAILHRSGCRVISVLGCAEAMIVEAVDHNVGVVVIGHGASQDEREELVRHFRRKDPSITIVSLLRRSDKGLQGADFSVPADDPALWERTVIKACKGYQ